MQPLQFLLAVLTLCLHQGATSHGESSIPSPLQAVLTANSELFSALADHNVYTDPNRSAVHDLQLLPGLSRFSALAFSTAPVLDFIASPHKEPHSALEAIGEMIAKINSSLFEAAYMEKHLNSSAIWTEHTRRWGNDDTNIRKAWVFLQNLLENGPTAKTMEEKSRLVREFTAFYAQADLEETLGRLHRLITGTKGGPIDCLSASFDMLDLYSAYLSSLMAVGLQMKVYYHALTDPSGTAAKAEEAMTQLSDVYFTMQNALLSCLESFMSGASRRILEEPGVPDEVHMNELESLYNWCEWNVTSVMEDDKPPTEFDKKVEVGPSHWVYLRCAPRVPLQPCTEELCPSQNGGCRNLKALGGDVCLCAKAFYGPKCERSVQNDVDQSLLGQGDNNPIIVPDLTTIYYSIMDLKALLRKTN